MVLLHGSGTELPLLEYLYRVVLHLLAFGAAGIVAHWWFDTIAR